MRKTLGIYVCILLLLMGNNVVCADSHPHIAINDSEKDAILKKMKEASWAQEIFNSTKKRLKFYIEKHQQDTTWILERYLMNRVPRRYYTDFISDADGTKLIAYKGNAPVPTVRVSPHKRAPITPEGVAYVLPRIKDLVPNDTSMYMRLLNPVTKKYEVVDPQSYVGTLNGTINELAYDASVIYWLTGEVQYAKFAADILDQWVNAVVYQHPIKGPGRTGFLDIQTLGDEKAKPLILAYDFLYPYLKEHHYSLKNYETVFERIANTLVHRGYVNNNWYAAESSTLVAAALALDNPQKRAYYLDFYLNKDTVVDGCGQLGLPTTVKRWFTADGHWKEPGGYHNYPVSKLIESAMMLENNGYSIFNKYPELLKASYVMLKYSFPNLTASAFGDTGRPTQSVECLECAIKMASKYAMPILSDLVNAAQLLEEAGKYDRKKGGISALLWYLPQMPAVNGRENHDDLWCRTGELDFASCYLQRNGMDLENGLMCVVQGASYNHNHSNGMSMELYGRGTVMGIDPGNGPTYEHPMHVKYYTQWGAHNTVVAAGSSTSLSPFRGGGGAKSIGAIELVSMEPLADQKAISDDFSYTFTKYYEGSTKTNQERLLSIVRIDEEHGFYVDLYRSDNQKSNDYLYHNIGDDVAFYTPEGDSLKQEPISSYPCVGNDNPGLGFFRSVQTIGNYGKELVAMFSVKQLETGAGYMKMWMPATSDMTYFTALAPNAKTAQYPYQQKPALVVSMRKEGPTGENPFVAVYEPVSEGFSGGLIRTVERIELKAQDVMSTALTVKTKKGEEYTFVNTPNGKIVSAEDWKCSADLTIFAKKGEKSIVYVGNGSFVENEDMRIEADNSGCFYVEYDQDSFFVRSQCGIKLISKNRKYKGVKDVLYLEKGERLFK